MYQRIFSWNLHAIGFGGVLERNEQIQKVFREVFFFTFQKMLYYGVLFGVGAFISWLFLPPFLWIVPLGIVLWGLYKAFSVFAYWYANAILMTDMNLVIVQWPKFFQRKSVRLDYWNLDDIQVEKIGISAFLNNYGTIYFQKANDGELMSVHKIKNPQKVANTIEAYREEMVDHKNFTEQSALKELIFQMVQTHVGTKGQPERNKPSPKPAPPTKETPEKKGLFQRKQTPVSPKKHVEIEKKLDDTGGIEIEL